MVEREITTEVTTFEEQTVEKEVLKEETKTVTICDDCSREVGDDGVRLSNGIDVQYKEPYHGALSARGIMTAGTSLDDFFNSKVEFVEGPSIDLCGECAERYDALLSAESRNTATFEDIKNSSDERARAITESVTRDIVMNEKKSEYAMQFLDRDERSDVLTGRVNLPRAESFLHKHKLTLFLTFSIFYACLAVTQLATSLTTSLRGTALFAGIGFATILSVLVGWKWYR